MPNKSPRLGTSLTRRGPLSAGEPPFRAELFGVEQLARHAQMIAGQHRIVSGRGANRLLARLEHNEEVLRTFNRATLAVPSTRRITPAEWSLDNFYLTEEQIQLTGAAICRANRAGSCPA
jgi:cyclic beta-1,2-glucan glucanotransferase